MDRWDVLRVRIWADGLEAAYLLDRSVRYWGDVLAGGWPRWVVVFDWASWVVPWPPLQQVPRVWGLQSWGDPAAARPIVAFDGSDLRKSTLIFDPPVDHRSRGVSFTELARDALADADLTLDYQRGPVTHNPDS